MISSFQLYSAQINLKYAQYLFYILDITHEAERTVIFYPNISTRILFSKLYNGLEASDLNKMTVCLYILEFDQ